MNEKCEGLQLVVFQDMIAGTAPDPWTGWSDKEEVTPVKDQLFLAVAEQHCFLVSGKGLFSCYFIKFHHFSGDRLS